MSLVRGYQFYLMNQMKVMTLSSRVMNMKLIKKSMINLLISKVSLNQMRYIRMTQYSKTKAINPIVVVVIKDKNDHVF